MAKEGGYQVFVLWNLIVTTACIAWKFETSSAIAHPIHLAVCVLLSLSALFWFLSNRGNSYLALNEDHGESLDLSSISDHPSTKPDLGITNARLSRSGVRKVIDSFFQSPKTPSRYLVVCIAVRVFLARSLIRNVECSWSGFTLLLPVLLALYELRASNAGSLYSSVRYVSAIALWSLSAIGVISFLTQRSTYICPSTTNIAHLIQCLELLLDAGIIINLSNLSNGHDSGIPWRSLSKISAATAGALSILGCLFSLEYLGHMNLSLRLTSEMAVDLLLMNLLCTNLVGSILYLLGELRPSTILTTASLVAVYVSYFQHSVSALSASSLYILFGTCIVAFGSALGIARLERDASRSQQHASPNQNSSRSLLLLTLVMLLTTGFSGLKSIRSDSQTHWPKHPIDILLSSARLASDKWQQQAAVSSNLADAVVQYKLRYRTSPPPRFDKWFEYAKSRNSKVIDDFDQINNDLEIFWGVQPSKIRELTAHIVERPWTEAAGIRISNGTVSIGKHMPPTHRWMMEGAQKMIEKFAEHLPDMDLAFNINDENRVAISWDDTQKLKAAAAEARRKLAAAETRNLKDFSDNIDSWSGKFMETEAPYPNEHVSEYSTAASFVSSFENYGVAACPPNATARQYSWWNKKAFCDSCASPHSLGQFIANWTLSNSLCHQPDIAHLHGFHLSPSAFKPTVKPLPIFSQSKISTFSDILYPSPWNYIDKVVLDTKRDKNFFEKDSTVFWRGATTEGFAIGGTWKGMQRQRFVHHSNNYGPNTPITLLLPQIDPKAPYVHRSVPFSALTAKTNISAAFVNEPLRCEGPDCRAQISDAYLPFSHPVDFQDHWQYKYLFDLDGAGFSGRFLPFLESHSLVFRAAAFRQWFDERLTAWTHYVPVDGRLHDMFDLIAYFGGVKGIPGADRRDIEAEKIAEEGRERARAVLRKEDMEIYMFRLLLEWGRIVDDKRDTLGFKIDVKDD